MKPIDNDDAALIGEVRDSLNEEVESLDASIESRLRQARFKAIDYSVPVKARVSYASTYQWGMGVVLGAIVLVSVITQFFPSSTDGMIAINASSDSDIIEEDTEEDIEMYEWLYKNYG